MDKYKVKISPRAIRDLDGIYQYIAMEKQAPEIARRQAERIKHAILQLNTFPYACQERMEGRYAGQGYRQLLIDNFIAIFRVEETEKTVYVLTVQYQRRGI